MAQKDVEPVEWISQEGPQELATLLQGLRDRAEVHARETIKPKKSS